MTIPRIITPAERQARRMGKAALVPAPRPIAQFRKKGCTTCKPIPVLARAATIPNDTTHGHQTS
jgi:hypothetical protein